MKHGAKNRSNTRKILSKNNVHTHTLARTHAYTVIYFTGIVYAVVRKISMLFINNKDYVFCIKDNFVGETE